MRHVERGAGGTEPNNRPSKSNHRSHGQSRRAPWHDRLHAPARTTRPMRHRDCEVAHTLQQKFFVLAFRAITVALWGRPRRRSHGRLAGYFGRTLPGIEKDDPSVRVIVTQGGAIAESSTHLSSRNPYPGRSGRDVAPSYQCSPSFEPSAAAVIIAGIPIATVASAIARASIMTIPLDSTSSSRS